MDNRYPFKPYKNVYKEPFLFGLPTDLFACFVGAAFIIGMMLLIVQSFVFAIFGLALLGGVYGALQFLVNRFGTHFFSKLMSYYTDQGFSVLRKNRTIKNILK